jgi:4-amino-4-deoxy-L-arabinose transferase-like glycosyltransferase
MPGEPVFRKFAGSQRFHFFLLTVAFIVTRIPVLFDLDSVILGWRPPDSASIAMNFLRNGFDILHPQLMWGGNGPGYVEMEFPIVQYATAVLMEIFGVHEALWLVVPLFSALGTVLLIYLLVSMFFDPATGLVAGLFAVLSPTLITFSEMFYDDPTMIFFTVLGLYAWARWLRSGQAKYFLASALAMTLAILIKPTALHMGLPLAFLLYQKDKWRFLRDPRAWMYFVLVIVPPLLWYYHAHLLYLQYGNTFGILSGGHLKTASLDLLLSPAFYTRTAARIVIYHLTPIVIVLLGIGVFQRQKNPERYLFHAWAVAVGVYVLVVAEGVFGAGNQYLLPVIAPGVALASIGFTTLARNPRLNQALGPPWRRGILTVSLVAIFLGSVVVAHVTYRSRDYWAPGSQYQHVEKSSGVMVGEMTEEGSLIIVVGGQPVSERREESMSPADIFYFSDRRGWFSYYSWTTREEIERLRGLGAKYLVASANWSSGFKEQCKPAYEHLRKRYTLVVDDSRGLVFDLGTRPKP